ncbi:MAG: zinc ribbon domain-containing protein [Ruminococcus sp.]
MSDKKRTYPWNKTRNSDRGAENEVYAGPEYFERQLSDEPQEEEEQAPMEGVYAGPPVMPPIMCTYAGPAFYGGTNAQAPAAAPAPAADSAVFCAQCGAAVREKDKFCAQCGAVLSHEAR